MVLESRDLPTATRQSEFFIGPRSQSIILTGSEEAKERIRDELTGQLSQLPTEELVAFAEDALVGMASEKYPWDDRARDTLLMLLPTVIAAKSTDREQISGEKWFGIYVKAVQTVPTNFPDRSIPKLFEVGLALSPVMLKDKDPEVVKNRFLAIDKAWSQVNDKFLSRDRIRSTFDAPKAHIPRDLEKIRATLPKTIKNAVEKTKTDMAIEGAALRKKRKAKGAEKKRATRGKSFI